MVEGGRALAKKSFRAVSGIIVDAVGIVILTLLSVCFGIKQMSNYGTFNSVTPYVLEHQNSMWKEEPTSRRG